MERMTNDELIRAAASLRTDMNKARLAIIALPLQLSEDVLDEHGWELEKQQGHILSRLEDVANILTDMIKTLGGNAPR